MPKLGANLKRRRHRGANERRQWAAAVVQKAMPRIMESLIEAVASLGEGRPALPSRPARHEPDEGEDESLAALLLRLLRTPETGEDSDAGANATTFAGENPSLG